MTPETTEALTYAESRRGAKTVHRVLVIEYHGRTPFAVYTDHASFDFDYCKRDGTLNYRNVGSGLYEGKSHQLCRFSEPVPPPGRIWIAPGVKLHRWESDKRPKVPIGDSELLAMGYVRLRKPMLLKGAVGEKTRNPFEAGDGSEDRLEYCSICDDNLPSESLCDHIYLPDCGDPVGAGSGDPSEESLFGALDWLATVKFWQNWCGWRYERSDSNIIAKIEKRIAAGKFRQFQASRSAMEDAFLDNIDDNIDDDECADTDSFVDIEDGLGWLTTLGTDTPAANAKTLKWIAKWRRTAKKRAAAGEHKRLIKELSALVTTEDIHAKIVAALGVVGKADRELTGIATERIREVLERFKVPETTP